MGLEWGVKGLDCVTGGTYIHIGQETVTVVQATKCNGGGHER